MRIPFAARVLMLGLVVMGHRTTHAVAGPEEAAADKGCAVATSRIAELGAQTLQSWLQGPGGRCDDAATQTAGTATPTMAVDPRQIGNQKASQDFAEGATITRLACVGDQATILLQVNFAARSIRVKAASGNGPSHAKDWSYIKSGKIWDGGLGHVNITDDAISLEIRDPSNPENGQTSVLDRHTGVLRMTAGRTGGAALARCWHLCLLQSNSDAAC